jgi:hypothetical protein
MAVGAVRGCATRNAGLLRSGNSRFSMLKSSFWAFTAHRKNQRPNKIFDSHRDPVRVKLGENHQKVTAA